MSAGIISFFNEERGFGFIQSADEVEDIFFHVSRFPDCSTPELGMEVEFEPYLAGIKRRCVVTKILNAPSAIGSGVEPKPVTTKRRRTQFTPDYDGDFLELTSGELHAAMNDIANWKLEAKLEDIVKYFLPIPEIELIQNGRKSYVIGRKGTGKTAIVQHLYNSSDGETSYAEKLSFKNFPFNELYSLDNSSYTRPNQYITIWKYIIYSYCCRLMARNESVDPLVRKRIRKAYPDSSGASLRRAVGEWTRPDFSVNLLGSGFSLSNLFSKKQVVAWQERVDILEDFILRHHAGSRYLILFDELDEDYKDMMARYENGGYIDLLTSLFKAVQDIRSVMGAANAQIFPVVFLRDDIFDLITDADKNKWRDLTADLEWDITDIKTLLKHRLSKSIGKKLPNFNETWYTVFNNDSVPYSGGRKSLRSFDFITRSTQGRPRDFIHYLQVCATVQLSKGPNRIENTTIREADKSYSNYLKSELVDEIHGLLPDINEVLGIFTQIRKWNFQIGEFRAMHQRYFESGTIKTRDVDFILKTLFYFSVIGNVSRGGYHVFRHENPDAALNFHENIVIHRGLMKSLQIF